MNDITHKPNKPWNVKPYSDDPMEELKSIKSHLEVVIKAKKESINQHYQLVETYDDGYYLASLNICNHISKYINYMESKYSPTDSYANKLTTDDCGNSV